VRIREIMSTPVETVRPEMPLKEVAQRMHVRGLRHLIVIKGAAADGSHAHGDSGAETEPQPVGGLG
jgi:hypothetical protein